jgi:hypothetical protein
MSGNVMSKTIHNLLKYPFLLVVILLCNNAKITSKKSISKVSIDDIGKAVKQSDPYEVFAQFLIQSSKKSGDFEDYSLDEVRRAVKKLAGGQEVYICIYVYIYIHTC